MLNFTYSLDGKLVSVSTDFTQDAINRNDFTCFDTAKAVAAEATTLTGKLHIAADRGQWTSPRYDVIEAPAVGTEVSRAFNGDYYPAGKIVKVSASLRRVVTEDGTVFYRRGNSDVWISAGTWGMSIGRTSRLNPSF